MISSCHSVPHSWTIPLSTNLYFQLKQLLSYLRRRRRSFGYQERGRRLALRFAVEICSHKTKVAGVNGVYATPSATDVCKQRQPHAPARSPSLAMIRVPNEQRGADMASQQQKFDHAQRGTDSAKDNMLFAELGDFLRRGVDLPSPSRR